jgi:hypothetical protein
MADKEKSVSEFDTQIGQEFLLHGKGKAGLYTLISIKEWNEILDKAGLTKSQWKYVFTHQAYVNRCYKP